MNTATLYRYPGPRPFQDTRVDRLLFFGRDHEKQSLLHMVLAERLVVLYAKSGIGKTSLINAGLLKPLREKKFLPFRVTFTDPKVTPLRGVYSKITDIVEHDKVDHKPGEMRTLWQFFKTAEFWSYENILLTPVLILDQFEELFTLHSADERGAFITELADLLRGRIPKDLIDSLKSDERFPYGEKPPEIKVVISIREDFLGQLEEMSQQIPDILNKRFRLLSLQRDQAREAVTKPAQVEDAEIHSAKFIYTPESVDAMLDFLCQQKGRDKITITDEVEPFQLQVLCQHIESAVLGKQKVEGADLRVEKSDLGGEEGMQRVLKDFYNNQINQLGSFWVKTRVRRLFEDGLISDTNRRLSLEEEQIERKAKVPKRILSKLVDNRLLRAEPRVGSVYYEVSHDALIEPIRKAHRELKRKQYIIGGLILLPLLLLVVVPYVAITQYTAYREASEIRARINAFERDIPPPAGKPSENTAGKDDPAFAPAEIRKFMGNHLRAMERGDMDIFLNDYAEKVDYLSAGVVSKDFIRKDKEYFNKRWPQRTYTIIGEVQTANTSYDDEKILQFTYDYYVQRKDKSIKGTARNSIRVKKIDNGLKIIGEKQEVVKRESE